MFPQTNEYNAGGARDPQEQGHHVVEYTRHKKTRHLQHAKTLGSFFFLEGPGFRHFVIAIDKANSAWQHILHQMTKVTCSEQSRYTAQSFDARLTARTSHILCHKGSTSLCNRAHILQEKQKCLGRNMALYRRGSFFFFYFPPFFCCSFCLPLGLNDTHCHASPVVTFNHGVRSPVTDDRSGQWTFIFCQLDLGKSKKSPGKACHHTNTTKQKKKKTLQTKRST